MLTIRDLKELEELWHNEATPNDFDGVLIVAKRAVELARLKPSGQVAEDKKTVESYAFETRDALPHADDARFALSRLAAGAHEAEDAYQRGRDDERAFSAQERDAARAEVERLKKQSQADLLSMEHGSRMLRAAESSLAAIRERAKDDARWLKEAEAGVVMGDVGEWDEDVHADVMAMHALPMLGHASSRVLRWVLEGDAPHGCGPCSDGECQTHPLNDHGDAPQDDEACPKREDGIHCEHWEDGAPCCDCGAPADPQTCTTCGAADCIDHDALHVVTPSRPEDMDLMCIACDQCTVHQWMPSPDAGPGWRCSECSTLSKAGRYPCSHSCTHDDASTPGHPERVKERSEAWAAMHPTGSCTCAGEGTCAWCDAMSRKISADASADHAREVCDHEDSTVYHRGAEAMRAACLAIALGWAQEQGFIDGSDTLTDLKNRIEGAAP
jgi:hypothetical protein